MGRTSTRIHHSPADKRRSNDSDTASPYGRAIRYRLKQRSRYATDNTVDTSCSVARRSLERKKIDPTFNIVVRARSYLGPRRSLYGVCVCVSVLEQSSDRESPRNRDRLAISLYGRRRRDACFFSGSLATRHYLM